MDVSCWEFFRDEKLVVVPAVFGWFEMEEEGDKMIHAPAPPTIKNKEAMLSQKPIPFFFLRRIRFSISGQLCSGASGRKPSAAR
jgi:hypothetical protein